MAWVVITNWGVTITDSIKERDSVAREEMKAHHEPYVVEVKSWQGQVSGEEWDKALNPGCVVNPGRGGSAVTPEKRAEIEARIKARIEGGE